MCLYPIATQVDDKYWCPVARVDNVYGDRNLFCTCIPVEESAALGPIPLTPALA